MSNLRNNWKLQEVLNLFDKSFNELLFDAHEIHIANHKKDMVQVCTLLSIKTGGCPEDCGYCSQSIHSEDPIEATPLMSLEEVKKHVKQARDQGSTRFCMGAAWRRPSNQNIDRVIKMVEIVHDLGMESCVTLGMLSEDQAIRLSKSGLNYYNHNLDTSRDYYAKVISTRNYQDRLNTLKYVREAGIKVCSGGILGLGESRKDRAELLIELANLDQHPESVPINMLVQMEGTRLYDNEKIDELEFIRTIAITRIMMPNTYVRLSAGRESMTDSMQALCFYAGGNSVFYGEELLTAPNVEVEEDRKLFNNLGMKIEGETKQINKLNKEKALDLDKKQNTYNLKLIN
ncbi:MAG: biotin synthase BioB [Gammaproteobacteria bacterium]|jgi:biotin synthase|nr:biotin synthase BioB [Gammaproteobacteria bacterium]MBT7603654.1 biotin synthase BioB [Gammaproteobacteria bacterium]